MEKLIFYLTSNRIPFIMVWDDDSGAKFIAGNNKDDKIYLNRKTENIVYGRKKVYGDSIKGCF